MKQNNENSKLRKFLHIINPRTLMGKGIILCTIIVLGILIWFISVTSMSISAFINTTADKTSFSDSTGQGLTNIENAKRMNNEDFNDFNIRFTCTNYNEDGKSATFRLYYYSDENSVTLASSISTKLLLTADYIDFTSWSSTYTVSSLATSLESAEGSSTYYKTYTTSSLVDFPTKITTPTWPYNIGYVSRPIAYLYLNYTCKENSKNVTKTYILRYDYNEFNIIQGGVIE